MKSFGFFNIIILTALAGMLLVCAPVSSFAQSGPGLLASGKKAIAKGKYKEAIRHLTRAMRADEMSQADLARAFFHRGVAYRKSGSHAEAIADLTRAVWFKSLPSSDRKLAYKSRALAYQSVGMSKKAQADFSRAGGSGGARRAGARPKGSAVKPTAQTSAQKTQKSASSGGFFSGIFGASTPKAKTPSKTAAAQQAGWTNNTTVKPQTGAVPSGAKPAAPWRTVSTRPATSTASARKNRPVQNARSGPGRPGPFTVQIASVRSKADANALWSRIKSKHKALLGTRKSHIVQVDLGAKGTFYRVQVNPTESREDTRSLCAALKQSGTYCIVTRR